MDVNALLKINRNNEVKADPRDPLARVIAPIVQGQIVSYLNDHGHQLKGVNRTTLVQSLSKRIINDLLCACTRARLRQAVLGRTSGSAEEHSPVVVRSRGIREWLALNWPLLKLPSPPDKGQTE